MYPENLKYTKDHEWIDLDGKTGVTDHAQKELGDVVFVELPKAGSDLKQGQELCVLESVKAVSNVYSPVSGKVIKINGELSNSPELINRSPYEEGWIAAIEIKDKKELDSLMSASEYKKLIGE
ncbi:MAG: glycine cleavage system protein GcvH [Candidatus Saganbacteria bacterium]|nr:glycine cleavage system protein GcvH [Candidatus Saganbacteria bacterium]